jgi:ribonucleoside-triphosphate reductase
LENFIEKGLYPYSRHYLQGVKQMRDAYFGNHFSTIGLIGMNEALLNFIGEDISTKRGIKFSLEVLDFMREKMVKYQEETGNLYNLEATPGEGTSYRQAKSDCEKYPKIITAGTKEVPYYTNSTMLPVGFKGDPFDALKLQDEIQCKYTGGVVFHTFLGERVSEPEAAKMFVKKVFEKFHLPYITLTPTFSICPTHGYISGEHFECPHCVIKQPCEVYSRVVGYLRPVQQWHKGKKQEFKERREFAIPKF